MANNPLEDIYRIAGSVGDVAREAIDRPAQPLELPEDTTQRHMQEDRSAIQSAAQQSKEFADRGIPTYRDTDGAVQPVRDSEGAALTSFDKGNRIAYDSTGNPQRIEYGESGAPELRDPFQGAPVTTDKKTGDQYQITPGLPWKWVGKDEEVSQRVAARETEKEVGRLAQITGQKLSLDQREMVAAEKTLKTGKKELGQLGINLDGDPELSAAFNAGDRQKVLDRIDGFFNEQFAAKDANPGFFSGGIPSPEVAARRQEIENQKSSARDKAVKLIDLNARLGTLRPDVQAQRGQMNGLNQQRIAAQIAQLPPELRAQFEQQTQAETPALKALGAVQQDQTTGQPVVALTPEAAQAAAQDPQARSTILGEIGKGLVRGWAGAMSSIGGLLRMVGAEETGSAVSDYWDDTGKDFAAASDIKTFDPANPRWWAARLPEVAAGIVPQLAVAAATGGASVPVQVAAFATMGGGLMAGDAYNDAFNERVSKGESPETARDGALGEAAFVGIIGSALDAVPGMEFLSSNPASRAIVSRVLRNKVAQRFVAGALTEGTTEVLQEITTDLAKYGYRADAQAFDDAANRYGAIGVLSAVLGGSVDVAIGHHDNTQAPGAPGQPGTSGNPAPVPAGPNGGNPQGGAPAPQGQGPNGSAPAPTPAQNMGPSSTVLTQALGFSKPTPEISQIADQVHAAFEAGASDEDVAEHLKLSGVLKKGTDPLKVAQQYREQSGVQPQRSPSADSTTSTEPVNSESHLNNEQTAAPVDAGGSVTQPPASPGGKGNSGVSFDVGDTITSGDNVFEVTGGDSDTVQLRHKGTGGTLPAMDRSALAQRVAAQEYTHTKGQQQATAPTETAPTAQSATATQEPTKAAPAPKSAVAVDPFENALVDMESGRASKAAMSPQEWAEASAKDVDFPLYHLRDNELEAAAKAVRKPFSINVVSDAKADLVLAQERASKAGALKEFSEIVRKAVQPLIKKQVEDTSARRTNGASTPTPEPKPPVKEQPLKGPILPVDAEHYAKKAAKLVAREVGRMGIEVHKTPVALNDSGLLFKGGKILMNPEKVAKTMENIRAAQQIEGIDSTPQEWVNHAVREEVLHMAQEQVAKAQGFKSITAFYDSIPESAFPQGWEEAVNKSRNDASRMESWEKKAEFVRMVAQKRWNGTITEALYKVLTDVLNFLKSITDNPGNDWLKAHVSEIEATLKGLKGERPVQAPEVQAPEPSAPKAQEPAPEPPKSEAVPQARPQSPAPNPEPTRTEPKPKKQPAPKRTKSQMLDDRLAQELGDLPLSADAPNALDIASIQERLELNRAALANLSALLRQFDDKLSAESRARQREAEDRKARIRALSDRLRAIRGGESLNADTPVLQHMSIPVDKIPVFLNLAKDLIEDGTNTPEMLYDRLKRVAGEPRARAYSRAMWSLLVAVNVDLNDVPDWTPIFAGRQQPDAQEPEQAPVPTSQADTGTSTGDAPESATTQDASPAAPEDPNIGREWSSTYGRQRIVAKDVGPTSTLYDVETVGDGTIRRYNANDIEQIIKRDEYRLTPEYKKEQEEAEELRKERDARDERQKAAREKTLSEIADFTKDMPAFQAGKVRDALLKTTVVGGVPASRKSHVERLVERGYTVQDGRDGRRLVEPNGNSWYVESEFTKTAIDYAQHLIARKSSPTNETSRTPEPTQPTPPAPQEPGPADTQLLAQPGEQAGTQGSSGKSVEPSVSDSAKDQDNDTTTQQAVRGKRKAAAPELAEGSGETAGVGSFPNGNGRDLDVETGVPTGSGDAATSGDSGAVRGDSNGRGSAGSESDAQGRGDAVGGSTQSSPEGTNSQQSGDGNGMVGDARPTSPARSNYYLTDPKRLVGGGPKARFRRNREALETLERIQLEQREPTPEELDTLAAYTGWGSFGEELFKGTWDRPVFVKGWEEENQWLRDLLGKEAWESANNSITNAHYTDPPTVDAVWRIIQKLGFDGGRTLEPSVGTGNFFSLMPRELMAKSELTGIELDKATGAIAKLLHPQANIQIKGYEDSKTADNFYDLVVGNWPFGNYGVADRRYNALKLSIHHYFFIKALDQVRPGGLVIGITSSSTMDNKGEVARRQMARRADLVASFRLPTGAFEEYAGTKVVTDLIILRKRPEPLASVEGIPWIGLTEVDTPSGQKLEINSYYAQNPENILGTLDVGHGTTFGRAGMIVHRKDDFPEVLAKIQDRLPEGVYLPWDANKARGHTLANTDNRRQNSVSYVDNKSPEENGFYVVRGDHMERLDEIKSWQVKDKKKTEKRRAEGRALVEIGNLVNTLLDEQRRGAESANDTRAKLKKAYQKFTKEHGHFNDSFMLDIFDKAGDPVARTIYNLETFDGKKWKPREIIQRDIMRKAANVQAGSIEDAYVISRNDSLGVDLDRVAELAKVPKDKVVSRLVELDQIYQGPDRVWYAREEYLGGNVRQKLREAQEAQEQGMDMERNIQALEAIQPKDVPYFAIEVQMGAAWVAQTDYLAFASHLLDTDPANVNRDFQLMKAQSGWNFRLLNDGLNHTANATTRWGIQAFPWQRIFGAAMNGTSVKVIREDADGNSYTHEGDTKDANEKIEAIREEFQTWIWNDPDRTGRLSKAYNEAINAEVTPSRNGSHLRFEGLALTMGNSEFDFRQHQKDAVWRGIQDGRAVFFHEVGTGKTFTIAGLALEGRRLGRFRKPILFAHNANHRGVTADIQNAYPGAKVLHIDNLSPKNRDNALQQIALDDWDLIVMPHSLIDRFTLRGETLMDMAREQIAQLEDEIYAAAEEAEADLTRVDLDDPEAVARALAHKRGAHTAKELVKMRARIKKRINEKAQKAMREDALVFEQLGIDAVMVDEAHIFKKVSLATRKQIKGLSKEENDRSWMLGALTSYVKRQNNGRGVFMLTGTPLTNNLNEAFNMMQYVMDDVMEDAGVRSFDDWFNAFAQATTEVELTSGGTYDAVTRLLSFVNVPELARMAARYFDVVLAKHMIEFKPRESEEGIDPEGKGRPHKKIRSVTAEMSPTQEAFKRQIEARYKEYKELTPKAKRERQLTGGDVPILMDTDGANSALDHRLVTLDPADDYPDSKLNKMVNTALAHYAEDPRATQMFFMERGYNDYSDVMVALRNAEGRTERDDEGKTIRVKERRRQFNLVRDVVEKLVKAGVPVQEIAVLSEMTLDPVADRPDDVLRKVLRPGVRNLELRPDGGPLEKDDIAKAMRESKIRFAIGSTQTMGTGVNAQDWLRAMHHLDAPWTPGEFEQRNGRGWRQGNHWNSVMEYRYFTEGSHDGRRWQVLLNKVKFIQRFTDMLLNSATGKGIRVLTGDGVDLNEGDSGGSVADFESAFSTAVGDPRQQLRAKLESDVKKLEGRRDRHFKAIENAKYEIRKIDQQKANAKEALENARRDTDAYRQWKESGFSFQLGKRMFTDRQQAEDAIKKEPSYTKSGVVAHVGPFEIYYDAKNDHVDYKLRFSLNTPGGRRFPLGNFSVSSIEGTMRQFPKHVETIEDSLKSKERQQASMREMLDQPFGRQEELDKKKAALAQIKAEISRSPKPAPSWLRNTLPPGSLVYLADKQAYDVAAHRADENGYWVLIEEEDGSLRPVNYLEVYDEAGTRIFEPVEGGQQLPSPQPLPGYLMPVERTRGGRESRIGRMQKLVDQLEAQADLEDGSWTEQKQRTLNQLKAKIAQLEKEKFEEAKRGEVRGLSADAPTPQQEKLYKRFADKVWNSTEAQKPQAPDENTKRRLIRSYQFQKLQSGFPSVKIADVAEFAGFTLKEAEEVKGAIMHMYRQGDIVSLPTGDWSLSTDRECAWGVRFSPEIAQIGLMLRLHPDLDDPGKPLSADAPSIAEVAKAHNVRFDGQIEVPGKPRYQFTVEDPESPAHKGTFVLSGEFSEDAFKAKLDTFTDSFTQGLRVVAGKKPGTITRVTGNEATVALDEGGIVRSKLTQLQGESLHAAPVLLGQIDSVISRLDPRKGARWFWEGTADVLERAGFKRLAKAVWEQQQANAKYFADAWKPLDRALRGLDKKQQQHAKQQWAIYFRHQETAAGLRRRDPQKAAGRQAMADATYKAAPQYVKNLIDAWKQVAKETGLELLKLDTQVKDGTTWRQIGHLGENYFPRKINRDTMEVLRDPAKFPQKWDQLVQDLIANGNIQTPDEADKFIRESVFKDETDSDYYANVEKARKAKLPESWLEYSFSEIAPWYVTNFARRAAQIKAYGQTTDTDKDLWDKTLENVPKTQEFIHTQEYIKAARDTAYYTRHNSSLAQILKNLQTIATGTFLSSPFSTIRNFISGTTQTAVMFGPMEAIRHSFNALVNAKARLSAHDIGVIRHDLFALRMEDKDDTTINHTLRKFANAGLQAVGFNFVEDIVRTAGVLSAVNFARLGAREIARDAGSAKSRQFIAVFRRMEADPLKIVREHAQGFQGEQEETERFIRRVVIETQGGYSFAQTPLHMSEPLIGFLTQFQKWGTQMSRFLAKHVINPLVHGTEYDAYFVAGNGGGGSWNGQKGRFSMDPNSGGIPVKVKVRSIRPFLYVLLFAILGGEALYALKELLTGRKRADASLEEILSNSAQPLEEAGQIAGRLLSDVIMAGTLGMLSDYGGNFRELATRGRFKNPLDPPGLQFAKNIYGLTVAGLQQGGLTFRDALDALYKQAPGLAFTERLTRRVTGDKVQDARNVVAIARDAGNRAAEQLGMPKRGSFGGDIPTKTANTAFYNNLEDALLSGDAPEARLLIAQHMRGKSPAEREKMQKGIKSSVSSSAPVRIGGIASAANRVLFFDWARKHLPAEDLNRIKEVDRNYWRTAQAIGVSDGEPVPREVPTFKGFTKR